MQIRTDGEPARLLHTNCNAETFYCVSRALHEIILHGYIYTSTTTIFLMFTRYINLKISLDSTLSRSVAPDAQLSKRKKQHYHKIFILGAAPPVNVTTGVVMVSEARLLNDVVVGTFEETDTLDALAVALFVALFVALAVPFAAPPTVTVAVPEHTGAVVDSNDSSAESAAALPDGPGALAEAFAAAAPPPTASSGPTAPADATCANTYAALSRMKVVLASSYDTTAAAVDPPEQMGSPAAQFWRSFWASAAGKAGTGAPVTVVALPPFAPGSANITSAMIDGISGAGMSDAASCITAAPSLNPTSAYDIDGHCCAFWDRWLSVSFTPICTESQSSVAGYWLSWYCVLLLEFGWRTYVDCIANYFWYQLLHRLE